ncbi:hypothetical protein OE88DRAFT_1715329 [Heliocybe sulcata]|uniref:Fe2OG dioxygenase domain-containing protein n=1 Tax=Heliocybe sulcata TaxID=5364 RepID=A0A5C3MK63_9AGAM|nr:hypothetical protein OE88DRAFT_1715329 [Heliocybe sulcata]
MAVVGTENARPISEEHLQALRDAIGDKPPYCSGIYHVAPRNFQLYYATQGTDARRIDLSEASEDEVKALADACSPATFGLENEDVLDESYRKAGALDATEFGINYHPLEHENLIKAIRSSLLVGHDAQKPIRMELYKLNDTPRADNMFGSLVVVYPTAHEGGALILRHKGKEWQFDSGKILAAQDEPRLAYAAFYGDVEHEVAPVKSGYRVTLTYNLYFGDPELPHTTSRTVYESQFREIFQRLLDDPTFLPEGGNLGFGLAHQYPVETGMRTGATGDPRRSISRARDSLKGSDAILMSVARELSLDTSLKVIYEESFKVMTDDMKIDPSADAALDPIEELVQLGEGAIVEDGIKLMENSGNDKPSEEDEAIESFRVIMNDIEEEEEPVELPKEKVYWVTNMSDFNEFAEPYVPYGNASVLHYMYGNMCLLVHVGPYGARDKPAAAKRKMPIVVEKL